MSPNTITKQFLKDLIVKNQLDEAIEYLRSISANSRFENTVLLIVSSYNDCKTQKQKQVLNSNNPFANIRNSLLEIIDELDKEHILPFKNENMQPSKSSHLPKEIEELTTPEGLQNMANHVKAITQKDRSIKNMTSDHPHYELITFLKEERANIATKISKKIFLSQDENTEILKTEIIIFIRRLGHSLFHETPKRLEFFSLDFCFDPNTYQKALTLLEKNIPNSYANNSSFLLKKYISTLKNTLNSSH